MGVDISVSNWATELIKKQKNPHGQLIWDRNTFQTSIYHSFSLKSGCIKMLNINANEMLKFCIIFITEWETEIASGRGINLRNQVLKEIYNR